MEDFYLFLIVTWLCYIRSPWWLQCSCWISKLDIPWLRYCTITSWEILTCEKNSQSIVSKSQPWFRDKLIWLKFCGSLLSFWLITHWGHFSRIFENECNVMKFFSLAKISAESTIKTFEKHAKYFKSLTLPW